MGDKTVTNTGEVVHTYTTVDIQKHMNSSHRVTDILATLESQYREHFTE